jgi:antirestriction protein ArdC
MSKDNYQIISDAVTQLMTEHGTDWSKGWQAKASLGHHNGITGKPYNGTNIFLLSISAMVNDFSSSEWGTFKQWQSKGAKVKKGQKGTGIIFFDKIKIEDKETEEEKMIPLLKGFTVFNADQVEGYTPKPVQPITETKARHQRAEALIALTGADIRYGGDKAFYVPSQDFVQMPVLEDFTGTKTSSDIECYYSTMFHELTHWTGAKTRLDRKMIGRFGSNAYAFEELIAELGAVFLTCQIGINVAPRPDHAKYLNNWLEVIKSDKRAMVKAFAQAQKASDFILGFEKVEQAQTA